MKDENSFNLGDFFHNAKPGDKTPPLKVSSPSKPYSVATPSIKTKTYQKYPIYSTIPMAAPVFGLRSKKSTAPNPDFFSEKDVKEFMDECVKTAPKSKP